MNIALGPWEKSDLDNLVIYANNYNIARYLTDAFPHPYNREDGLKFIGLYKTNEPTRIFAIEVNNEALGSIGLVPQTEDELIFGIRKNTLQKNLIYGVE